MEGKISEELVAALVTGKGATIEVKRDFAVSKTGNVLIEHGHNKGTKDSGITTSEAEWYAIILDGPEYNGEVILFIKTARLREIVDVYGKGNPKSGKQGYSSFKLVDLWNLTSMNSEIHLDKRKKSRRSKPKRSY